MEESLILLVEDNRQILEGNRYFLEQSNYRVDIALTLAAARQLLKKKRPDLIILDIMLPDGNGLDFIKEVKQYTDIPVLLLTSLNEPDDVVRGLNLGGDDYLSKPYHINVLLARVNALLRRSNNIPEVLKKGVVRLDILSGKAFLEEEDLLLTPKQFALLLLLMRNEGSVLSSTYLYETVWKQPLLDDCNALWKQMSHLNTKLSGHHGINLSLYRGEGYCLDIFES